jgi:hypothetical protein
MERDVIAAVQRAGKALLAGYSTDARPADRADLHRAGTRLDALVGDILRPAPAELRPRARRIDRTWTAVRGGGAFLDGAPIRVSAKTALDAAIVTTTQPHTAGRRFADATSAPLVAEAGAVVTDLRGQPWRPGHAAARTVRNGVH